MRAKKPILDVGNIVSILISSDFLQMHELVKVCLQFFKENASAIIKSPIDLNCISSKLLTQLAARFHNYELDEIKDKRDKITSKLFIRKLEALLLRSENVINKCARCGQLYAASQKENLVCEKSRPVVDFRGMMVAHHIPSSSFEFRKHLVSLRTMKMPWREIYWRIWGITHHLRCAHCDKLFAVCDWKHCSYHPNDAIFHQNDNTGFYPCCDSLARRFSTFTPPSGCKAQHHKVEEPSDAPKKLQKPPKKDAEDDDDEIIDDVDEYISPKRIYELLKKYSDITANPFTPIVSSRGDELASERERERDRKMSASSSNQKLKRGSSLSSMLAGGGSEAGRSAFSQYSVGGGSAHGIDEEDVAVYSFGESRQASGGSGWMSDGSDVSDEGDDSASEDSDTDTRPTSRFGSSFKMPRVRRESRSSSGSRKRNGSPWISVSTSTKANHRRTSSDGRKMKRRAASAKPDQRMTKTVRMDAMREDDRNRMSSLVERLTSLRTSNSSGDRGDTNKKKKLSSNSSSKLNK